MWNVKVGNHLATTSILALFATAAKRKAAVRWLLSILIYSIYLGESQQTISLEKVLVCNARLWLSTMVRGGGATDHQYTLQHIGQQGILRIAKLPMIIPNGR